jgi:hypothetical protein
VRVIYPYTTRGTEESEYALRAYAPQAEKFYVGDDDFAYGYLLERCWHDGESFLVVEHDIVIGPNTVAEFESCPEEWCSAGYTYFDKAPNGTPGGGLGCTKFSSELLRRWPGLMSDANGLHCPGHPDAHWCTRDLAIYTLLRAGGPGASQWPAKRHEAHTEVGHRAGPCAHGCKTSL